MNLFVFTRLSLSITQTRITKTRVEACNFTKKGTLLQVGVSNLTKARNSGTLLEMNLQR